MTDRPSLDKSDKLTDDARVQDVEVNPSLEADTRAFKSTRTLIKTSRIELWAFYVYYIVSTHSLHQDLS